MDSLWETPKKDKGGESGDHPEDQTPTEGQGKQGRGRESLSLSALPRVVWQCCRGVLEPRDGCKRCLSGRNRPCTGALSTPQCSGLNWEQPPGSVALDPERRHLGCQSAMSLWQEISAARPHGCHSSCCCSSHPGLGQSHPSPTGKF